MLRRDLDPTMWRIRCMEHFQKPMSLDENARDVVAKCVRIDEDGVEFVGASDGYEFFIPTELFTLIPHVGATVTIGRVHYTVRLVEPINAPRIDLITGRAR